MTVKDVCFFINFKKLFCLCGILWSTCEKLHYKTVSFFCMLLPPLPHLLPKKTGIFKKSIVCRHTFLYFFEFIVTMCM